LDQTGNIKGCDLIGGQGSHAQAKQQMKTLAGFCTA